MILLTAVAFGVLCGFIRARMNHTSLKSPEIKHIWLVLAGFLPQFFAFSFPATRTAISDRGVAWALIVSQLLLLVFIWINRKIPGGWWMGLGLLLNFIVILINGGMMPLTPENAQHLLPEGSSIALQLGARVGISKDVLLEKAHTNLWFLSDIFLLPEWLHYPLAFSIGDICLSVGAFYLFWQMGKPKNENKERADLT